MTVSSTTNRVSYTGNDVTTEFSFPHLFYDEAHLEVSLVNADGLSTLKTITTDYTVTGEGVEAGGTVTMNVAPTSTETLVIRRVVPLTQLIDYINGGAFPSESHERGLDLLTMIAQQLNDVTINALRLSAEQSGADLEIEDNATTRANTVVGFDNNGNIRLYTPAESGVASLIPQVYSVSAGVTDITVNSYTPNVNSRLYFLNSAPIFVENGAISEVNSTTVRLANAPTQDSTLIVIGFATTTLNTAAASNVSTAVDGGTNVENALASRVPTVATLAKLLAVDVSGFTGGEVRKLNGVYNGWAALAKPDQSGGAFRWNASRNKNSANGITIIDPSVTGGFDGTSATIADFLNAQGSGSGSGVWERKYDGQKINLLWAGAIGDGSTINTTPIQKTLNLAALGKGVFIPEGEFVSGPITFNSLNLRISGESGGNQASQTNGQLRSSVIRFNNTTGDSFTFSGAFNVRRLVMEHLTIKGVTTGNLVSLSDVSQATFDNCIINSEGSGSVAVYADLAYEISFNNSFIFQGANTRTGVGVLVDNSAGGLFGQINFYNTTLRDFDRGLSFNANYSDGKFFETVNFIGSQAKGCNIGLQYIGKIRSGVIEGSYFEGNKLADIEFAQGAEGVGLKGNFYNSPAAIAANIRIGRNQIADDNKVRNISIEGGSIQNINAIGVLNNAEEAHGGGIEIARIWMGENASGASGISLSANHTAVIDQVNFGTITTKISGSEYAVSIRDTAEWQGSVVVENLSSNKALAAASPDVQTYNPQTVDRVVRLAAASSCIGKQWLISCAPSASNALVVRDSTDTVTLAILTAGQSARCWSDGVNVFAYVL